MRIATKYRFLFFLIFLISGEVPLFGQNNFALQIEALDKDEFFLKKQIKYNKAHPDSLAVINELKAILKQLQGQAYLEAAVERISRQDSIFTALFRVGEVYEWANLKNGNVESAFLSQVGYRERLYQDKLFNYKEIIELQEALLEYAENNGFPFASVWLDSIVVKNNEITAQLFMQKNRLILIDTINIIGDARISDVYLENYLGLKEGSPYSKNKVLKIRNRIRELPFLKEKRDATVTFAGEKATINLFLEKRKASRFDFIFGFLPTNTTAINGGPEVKRFQFTATFNADMQNQFGLGERIFMEFEQLRPETQRLNLEFQYPYVMNLPFGVDLKFDLYKRDTSYLDVQFDLGLQYLFEGGNYVKAFWNRTSTNILNVNESILLNSKRLPSNLDVSNTSFGLEYNVQKLDYRFNPRKGWSALIRGGAGIKEINKNNTIIQLTDPENPDFSFESLYDTLNLKTFQYRIKANIQGFLPLFKRSVLKAGVQTGIIIAEEDLYQNEQYRIGGNRIMRGYDEESIFASRYGIFTLEYRFLIGQNSYLYAFGDYGYVENKTTTVNRIERPLGFGSGITFETGVGIFGFSLALGRLPDNSFDFRNLKSHFGYVSFF